MASITFNNELLVYQRVTTRCASHRETALPSRLAGLHNRRTGTGGLGASKDMVEEFMIYSRYNR